jgi:CheY-like chemotaxis protein
MYSILVVDDLADNRFLLQTLLEAEGFLIETAIDGESALHKVLASPPDLILLDVMMPGMNGYELTYRLRQTPQFAKMPILLITAHSEQDARQGYAAGANDLITKPIDFDFLIRRIHQLLKSTKSVSLTSAPLSPAAPVRSLSRHRA